LVTVSGGWEEVDETMARVFCAGGMRGVRERAMELLLVSVSMYEGEVEVVR
jgi:hypothetical protein